MSHSESVLESPDMATGKGARPQLFLASNSPRRKELLDLCGWSYGSLSTHVDETPLPGEQGRQYVQRLAESKAVSTARHSGVSGMIIAADTTVVDARETGESAILGKPAGSAEAIEMLRRLRGHTHQVHTAIFLLDTPGGGQAADLCSTDVPMREYTNQEIEAYVASGDPLDKAGAYAIQHPGFHPVEKLDGCYANVMGLPLCHLARSLKKMGIPAESDVPHACQAALNFNCPVYQDILGRAIL